MRFGNPHFLKMLIMVPAIILFYVWAFKKKHTLIERFVSPQLKAALLIGVSFGKQRAKATLLVLTLLFAILALLRPQWGFHWETITRRGVDIIIAVDVSKSMLAQDVSPTRIIRAKRKIADLLSLIQGDRVGLIAFAGEAFVQCPLTLDHGAAAIFLDAIDTDLIPTPGSAIGETITTAIRVFEKSKKKRACPDSNNRWRGDGRRSHASGSRGKEGGNTDLHHWHWQCGGRTYSNGRGWV